LISSAQDDGFSLLHFFKIVGQMGFCFMDIELNHEFRVNQLINQVKWKMGTGDGVELVEL